MQQLPARLTLFGCVATPVALSVEPRPRWERMLRAVLSLVAAAAFAPILMFIPPHAEWIVLSVATGIYWFRKNWIAEFVVGSFEGVCPKCHTPVNVKSGTTLRFPHGVVCYKCHEHPELEPGEAPPLQPLQDAVVDHERAAPEEIRPLRIWSPSSSEW
jgi:predicted CXXCH cytochrome family protein